MLSTLQDTLNLSFWVKTLLFATLYLLFQIYFINYRLVLQTILGAFPIEYKLTILLQLAIGFWHTFPIKDVLITLTTALCIGGNISLLLTTYHRMKYRGDRVKMSLGGAGVLTFVSGGCPSCGITILSILGPATGSFSVFVHTTLIQTSIILILIGSFVYTLFFTTKGQMCEVRPTRDQEQRL